jgi:hypothetical protein
MLSRFLVGPEVCIPPTMDGELESTIGQVREGIAVSLSGTALYLQSAKLAVLLKACIPTLFKSSTPNGLNILVKDMLLTTP